MPGSLDHIIILLGPTASGKTAVSIPLARILDAEIISADSRQVYTGLDIGTAKPSIEERAGIPHHLIDVIPPNHDFSVADFQNLAFERIAEIRSRGKNPLVVGGTGLYIRALIDRPGFQHLPPIPGLRQEILDEIRTRGSQAVYSELTRLDPEAAANIHPNNIPRLVRAMEVVRATGRRFSDSVRSDRERSDRERADREKPGREKDGGNSSYSWRLVGLRMDRELLYDRINRRVAKMIDDGWVEEVANLLENFSGDEKPLAGLGYRDIVAVVRGRVNLAHAVPVIQRDTRRFAKRQLTFFRRLPGVEWIDLAADFDPEKVAKEILSQ